MNSQLNSVVVRAWMERALRNGVPLGMHAEESLAAARAVWRELLLDSDVGVLLGAGTDLPDVLHALGYVLKQLNEGDSIASLQTVAAVYRLIVDRPELLPDQDEARALAAEFAYVAWNMCRRTGRCREMRQWEQSCNSQATLQDSARDFLSLPLTEQPERLRERFLLDDATMLAFCHQLAFRRNRDPARAEADGRIAYHWLAEQGTPLVREDRAYFAGQLALCVAVSCKHLGRFHDAEGWAELAERWFRETCCPDPSLAKLELFSIVLLFDRHLPERALEAIPRVMANLKRFELDEEYQRCRFLEASALKSVGRLDEGLDRLVEMSQEVEVRYDPMLLGLVLINMAELRAARGEVDQSVRLFAEALPVLELGGMPWGLADRLAMIGEVLRDQGRLDEAVRAYRSAISLLDYLRMDARAAYLRVVVAETLIASARQKEAIDEILVALPLLDREALIPPAIAAIALLRESIRRQQADPHAFRELREQLERSSGGSNR